MTIDPASTDPQPEPQEPNRTAGNAEYLEELPEETTQRRPREPASEEKLREFAKYRRDPQAGAGVAKKKLVSVPAKGSPPRDRYLRTSTDPRHNGTLPLFYDKGGDGGIHLVEAHCVDHLGADRVKDSYCVLTVTRQGSYFLWCTPLEDSDGSWNAWHESAHEGKEACADEWLTFIPNKEINGYDTRPPLQPDTFPEPEFPDIDWATIVKLTFRRRIIDKPDHPIIVRILGGSR
jgi:hypothetical protein